MKKNNLPQFWCVKCNTDNPNWKKVIDYLNNVIGEKWAGCNNDAYYGYDGNHRFKGTDCHDNWNCFKNNPTVLTIEQFVEMTDAPEYVECIKETCYNTYGKIGKIYQVMNWFHSSSDCRLVGTTSGSTAKNRFKPSTKEAFDKQNQVKEFAIGTYVVFLQDYGLSKKGGVDEIISDNYFGDKQYVRCKKRGLITRESDWVKWFATKEEAIKFSETLINKPKETMRKINYTQAQQIVDIACSTWKGKLFDKWGKQIVLKQDIEISEEFYQHMRKACTSDQNQLFDEIFGKDVKFKVGDWVYIIDGGNGATGANDLVGQITDKTGKHGMPQSDKGISIDTGKIVWKVNINAKLRPATEKEIQKAKYIPEGTPCLVRDFDNDMWKLAYSLGNGKFQSGGSSRLSWRLVQVLDMNNLPKY